MASARQTSAGRRLLYLPVMARRKLPIGIQTFRKIREEGCYYVDKTAYIRQLVEEGSHYFLSRPRRFGKSLFVDTLKEVFEGDRALFEGLDIYDQWDWPTPSPVLRLSLGGGNFADPGHLPAALDAQLDINEEENGVRAVRYDDASLRFGDLIRRLHRQTGQRVVVLVDEYDKPILDALDTPAAARANRDLLRGFYAVIKDNDAHVRFVFLTGVSKFSKVSLFSGLNNLTDITLDPAYSSLCGYTDDDLDTVFAPELPGLDRELIRDWYNGYAWLGNRKVYNPFDILLLFRRQRFGAHWFETGTPAFLVDLLASRGVSSPKLDGMLGTDDLLSAFDVDHIGTEALLFQTGYLTIVGVEDIDDEPVYRLGYPNREVRQSLNRSLLHVLTPDPSSQLAQGMQLRRLLAANDFAGLESLFRALFAGIPHDWHRRNDIANFEGYYASVFYSYFAATGLPVIVEDSSSGGRVDMAVVDSENVYLMEFKVLERSPEGSAMAQLKDRRYADKYRDRGMPIHLVAVEFSRETRNVASFAVEPA